MHHAALLWPLAHDAYELTHNFAASIKFETLQLANVRFIRRLMNGVICKIDDLISETANLPTKYDSIGELPFNFVEWY